MDNTRYKIERTVLDRNFPGRFTFINGTSARQGYLDLNLRTSAARDYRLKIMIPRDYPSSVPEVYLVRPEILRTSRGTNLADISPSHPMHTLKPMGNYNQLCHYKAENWHANVTLYKVALKCLIWLEAYEQHLRTGKPLIHFLGP